MGLSLIVVFSDEAIHRKKQLGKRVGYKQLQKEKKRIGAAIEGLAQRGILVKDMEDNINIT